MTQPCRNSLSSLRAGRISDDTAQCGTFPPSSTGILVRSNSNFIHVCLNRKLSSRKIAPKRKLLIKPAGFRPISDKPLPIAAGARLLNAHYTER